MIECPDYGDVCLVPRGWYRQIESRQIVYCAREYGFDGELTPVVLRGSRHARIHKHYSHRDYGHSVLLRYIRMRRITCLESSEWEKFMLDTVLPMAQKQPWWHRQRSLWEIFYYMVGEFRVFIDGRPIVIADKRQMVNVKKIHAAMKRMETA